MLESVEQNKLLVCKTTTQTKQDTIEYELQRISLHTN